MRLALRFGRADWRAFLDELDWRTLQEWRAALEIVGVDDEWRRHGELIGWLHVLAAASGGQEAEKPPAEDFMNLKTLEEQPQPKATPSDQVATLRGMCRR